MSAKILQFVPRSRRSQRPTDSRNAFRSTIGPDDLVMDHADTAPCEWVFPHDEWLNGDEPA